MARSRKYELGVGCLLLGAMAVLAFMALELGALSRLGGSVDVDAKFSDAAGLSAGAMVSVAGVPIGTVRSLEADTDEGLAIVHISLRPDAHVRESASVRIRARSLLGEKYLELEPGDFKAPLAKSGDQLRGVGEQVEVDELLAMIGPLVQGIDPVAMNKVLKSAADAVDKDPERLSRMLDNADVALGNAATASKDLSALMADGRRTLGDVDQRARQTQGLLDKADKVLGDVDSDTERLPPILDQTKGTLDDTRSLIAHLEDRQAQAGKLLDGFSGFDKWEIRRLLREEGILVRLAPTIVDPATADHGRYGKKKTSDSTH